MLSSRAIIAVVLAVAALAGIEWVRLGPVASFVFSGATALALLAALNTTLGLTILLVVMPFDRTLHPALQHFAWYPRALHVVDLIAIALAIGFAIRVLRRQVRLEWRWYDGVYLAFLAILALSAVHGLLEHHRYVLREGRAIPWLLTYFPAREMFARLRDKGTRIEPLLLGYGMAYCLGAFVLAYLGRGRLAHASDVLLPRLPYVVDVTPLVVLVLVGMGAFIWLSTDQRLSLLAGAGLIVYGSALAISNTRSYLLGLTVAGLALAFLLLRRQERRWSQAVRLSAAVALLLVGMAIPHGVRAGIVRANSGGGASAVSASPGAADPMPAEDPEARQIPELAPMPMAELARVAKLQRGQDENLINRMREVQAAWKDAKSHPIAGVGLGLPLRFTKLEFGGKSTPVQQSFLHSGYFAVLRSAGVPGLLGLLAVVGCFMAVALRQLVADRRDPILLACALILVAMIPIIQFANVVLMPGAVWLAAVLGLVGSLTNSPRQPPAGGVRYLR